MKVYENKLHLPVVRISWLLRVQETWGDLAGDFLAAGEGAGDQGQHEVTWHPLTYFEE